jgi:uncharacterized protein (UPF0248 family)
MGPHEVLNELKWHPKLKLQDVKITITHRGAPNDKRTIQGSEVLELKRSFMRVASREGEVNIPYHRVLKIEARGEVLWRKT